MSTEAVKDHPGNVETLVTDKPIRIPALNNIKQIDLEQTEKIEIPVELMTLDEYIDHLNYLPNHDLPELADSGGVIAAKLSAIYSKVMLGGKYRFAEETNGCELLFHAPNEFKNLNRDMVIPYMKDEKRKDINVFDLFEKSRETPKFSSVEFNPAIVGDYGKTKNMFRGYPFDKGIGQVFQLGDGTTRDELLAFTGAQYPNAVRFIEHIWDNVADDQQQLVIQILAWVADIIQNPEKNPKIALVLQGAEKGTGKTVAADIIGSLVGKAHSFKTSNSEQIIGKFNGHLSNKMVVIGEEMSWGGSRNVNNIIKDKITSSVHSVELKGVDIIMMSKYYRLILVTNEEWAVNASSDERRYIFCAVAPHQRQNDEYFAPFFKGTGFCQNMLKDVFQLLANVDYSSVDLSCGVETKGIKNQKIESMKPIEQWWSQCLDDGCITKYVRDVCMSVPHNFDMEPRVQKGFVHDCYISWLDKYRPANSERITNTTSFGIAFMKLARGDKKQLITTDQKKDGKPAYTFSDLDQLKKQFYSNY